MGWNLSSKGGLTTSQKNNARMLGVSEEEYKKRLLEKFGLERGQLPHRILQGLRKDNIKAKNPVMVIGHGPSYLDNMDKYNKVKIPKVVVDASSNDCFKHNVIPDYIVTLESGKKNAAIDLFNGPLIAKHKTTVVGSFITREDLRNHIEMWGGKFERFTFAEQSEVSNVGLFGCVYARDVLKADAIILSGFEHMGSEYAEYDYKIWQTDFFRYVQKIWPKQLIVNCSGVSALYYKDFIIETTLDRLKIDSS